MKQNSLFDVKIPVGTAGPAKAPVAPPKKKMSLEAAMGGMNPGSPKRWIPKEGERVIVKNINDGIEGVIDCVDIENLYHDYIHPVQVTIPKLKMWVRVRLRDVKPIGDE